jgi:hypothetical protein
MGNPHPPTQQPSCCVSASSHLHTAATPRSYPIAAILSTHGGAGEPGRCQGGRRSVARTAAPHPAGLATARKSREAKPQASPSHAATAEQGSQAAARRLRSSAAQRGAGRQECRPPEGSGSSGASVAAPSPRSSFGSGEWRGCNLDLQALQLREIGVTVAGLDWDGIEMGARVYNCLYTPYFRVLTPHVILTRVTCRVTGVGQNRTHPHPLHPMGEKITH